MLSAAVLLIQSTALLTTSPIARSQPPAAAALHRRCSTPVAKAAVQSLSSVEALTAALNGAASDEQVVCIKFYMQSCRMCRAIKPKFERLAGKQGQHSFYEVDVHASRKLARHCGIDNVPAAQFWRAGELVQTQALSPQRFTDFEQSLIRLSTDNTEEEDDERARLVARFMGTAPPPSEPVTATA